MHGKFEEYTYEYLLQTLRLSIYQHREKKTEDTLAGAVKALGKGTGKPALAAAPATGELSKTQQKSKRLEISAKRPNNLRIHHNNPKPKSLLPRPKLHRASLKALGVIKAGVIGAGSIIMPTIKEAIRVTDRRDADSTMA